LFWEASAWFPSCYVYLIENVVQPVLGKVPDEGALKKEEPRWRELAGVLEQRLQRGERKWLCGGEEPTVADLAVASSMHLWKRERFPIEGFPALRRWIGRVEGLECWRDTQGDVEKAFPEGK
jgi:glutathione S-transferase